MDTFIRIDAFADFPWLTAAFSTKTGGVSPAPYGMNLSFTVGDDPQNVRDNYEKIAGDLGIRTGQMVYAHQTHTTNVRSVTKEMGGMGILKERSFSDIDALVTSEPGVCLVTGHADCVPIYFADPKARVIGLAHAGWKGTVGNIAANVIREMCGAHGANAERILAVIGPCICRGCYEIGEDVAEIVRKSFPERAWDSILFPRETPGKYDLDLPAANTVNLIGSGILPGHITQPAHCTCCESGRFHSHRATKGHRGGNSAFLMMDEKTLSSE